MGNGQNCSGDTGKMARVCLIHECAIMGAPVCCEDCGPGCKERCKNSPNQCNCVGGFILLRPSGRVKNPRKTKPKRKKRQPFRHLFDSEIIRITELLKEGKLKQHEIAKLFGVNPSTITRIKSQMIGRDLE